MSRIEPYVIYPTSTIRDAMVCIDKNGRGISLVIDAEFRLLATISDGDIRRAILDGVNLDLPVQTIYDERRRTGNDGPLTAPEKTVDADLLIMMNQHDIRQIPVVDGEGRLLRVAFLSDLAREYELPLTAVVMAGGFGMRLRPLTDTMPKPMLPIGDRPILQWTIEQLKRTGIHQISLTTHYKPEAISNHFGNGNEFGVEIKYFHEDQPLGTAGALSLLGRLSVPLLVLNGDIISNVDFRTMLDYHRKHQSCLTVGVRRYEFQVPYGVVDSSGENVTNISEKPKLQFLVNAGIYLLEPSTLDYVPSGQRFDMPELIQRLIGDHQKVVSFPIVEYWLDVGRPDDYATAQHDIKMGRISQSCRS